MTDAAQESSAEESEEEEEAVVVHAGDLVVSPDPDGTSLGAQSSPSAANSTTTSKDSSMRSSNASVSKDPSLLTHQTDATAPHATSTVVPPSSTDISNTAAVTAPPPPTSSSSAQSTAVGGNLSSLPGVQQYFSNATLATNGGSLNLSSASNPSVLQSAAQPMLIGHSDQPESSMIPTGLHKGPLSIGGGIPTAVVTRGHSSAMLASLQIPPGTSTTGVTAGLTASQSSAAAGIHPTSRFSAMNPTGVAMSAGLGSVSAPAAVAGAGSSNATSRFGSQVIGASDASSLATPASTAISEDDDKSTKLGPKLDRLMVELMHMSHGVLDELVLPIEDDVYFDGLAEADRPWRSEHAEQSDYFNFGFSEESWKDYCVAQQKWRFLMEKKKIDKRRALLELSKHRLNPSVLMNAGIPASSAISLSNHPNPSQSSSSSSMIGGSSIGTRIPGSLGGSLNGSQTAQMMHPQRSAMLAASSTIGLTNTGGLSAGMTGSSMTAGSTSMIGGNKPAPVLGPMTGAVGMNGQPLRYGVCFDYQKTGFCSRGSMCKYAHDLDSHTTVVDRPMGVCFEFQNKGSCSNGSNCRWKHVGAPSASKVPPSHSASSVLGSSLATNPTGIAIGSTGSVLAAAAAAASASASGSGSSAVGSNGGFPSNTNRSGMAVIHSERGRRFQNSTGVLSVHQSRSGSHSRSRSRQRHP